MMRRTGGILLIITGVLACPCPFIVTPPLLASLLAGTTLGSLLTRNTGLVYTGALIYFVVALALGSWFLFGSKRPNSKREEACPRCRPVEPGALSRNELQLQMKCPRQGVWNDFHEERRV